MEYAICYITASGQKEADKISDMLLKKKLIACANMFPIRSRYWWKDKIVKSNEVLMFCKTRMSKSQEIIKEVKKIHSYDVPCINFIKVEKGSKDFLKWADDCIAP